MSVDEATRIINNQSIIKSETEKLKAAQEKMKLLKKCREKYLDKPGTSFSVDISWNVDLIVEPRTDSYYSREKTIKVKVPYAVVEQQIVYEIDEHRRKIIMAGGLA